MFVNLKKHYSWYRHKIHFRGNKNVCQQIQKHFGGASNPTYFVVSSDISSMRNTVFLPDYIGLHKQIVRKHHMSTYD